MKVKNKPSDNRVAKNPDELGKILGLNSADTALMKYKAELVILAKLAIKDSHLTVNELVKRSGIARSKVSAVKNGASVSVSCDLLIKIISAAGKDLQTPRAAKRRRIS